MSYLDLSDYTISNNGVSGDGFEIIISREFGHYMTCVNTHSLVVASKDALFESALKNADILVPDGTGILIKCWTSSRNMEIMP